jgi:LssY C-terminus
MDILLRRSSLKWRLLALGVGLLLLYLLTAYLIAPEVWVHYARRHPSFDEIPRITYTRDDHPGDPLNVSLIGTERQVKTIMVAAKWYPADPLTFRSCLEIASATVLKRPYDAAPVSNLYLFGRKEDLAFEQPAGKDPRHRHHVRLWRAENVDSDGRPVWIGADIYDKKVGFSHTTGQITHHTGADIDAERDYLFRCLEKTGDLAKVFVVNDFHKTREGKNGGGDPWHTDGNLYTGVIRPDLP